MLPLPPFVGAPAPVFAPVKQTVTLVQQAFTATTSPFVSDGSVTTTVVNGRLTVTSSLDWYGVVATFSNLAPGRIFLAQGVYNSDSDVALVGTYTSHWDTLDATTTTATSPVPFALAAVVPDDGVVILRIAPGVAGSTVTADDLLVQLVSPLMSVVEQTFTTDIQPFVAQPATMVSLADQTLTLSSVYQPWTGVTYSFNTSPGSRYFMRVRMKTEIPNSAFVLVKDGTQTLSLVQWAGNDPAVFTRALVFTTGVVQITLGTAFPGFNSVFDRFVLERLPDAP